MMRILTSLCCIFYCFGCFSSSLKPSDDNGNFFEFGAGLTIVDAAHYAGSDQSEFYALPFPYIVYKSKDLSLNREGLKQHLFKSGDWDMDIGYAGNLPVKSEDNRARIGMPDLDWVGLAGPSLNYAIFKNDQSRLRLLLPVRLGIATDFSNVEFIGWEFEPTLRYDIKLESKDTQWSLISSASLFYSSSRYLQYYYNVEAPYASTERPEYHAEKGFGGHQVLFGLTRRSGQFWMGAFLRHRSVSHADFAGSPLVKQADNIYAGLAFAWIISDSD